MALGSSMVSAAGSTLVSAMSIFLAVFGVNHAARQGGAHHIEAVHEPPDLQKSLHEMLVTDGI